MQLSKSSEVEAFHTGGVEKFNTLLLLLLLSLLLLLLLPVRKLSFIRYSDEFYSSN
jgi:hypothetical protein